MSQSDELTYYVTVHTVKSFGLRKSKYGGTMLQPLLVIGNSTPVKWKSIGNSNHLQQ
jgi:hypothetical protein